MTPVEYVNLLMSAKTGKAHGWRYDSNLQLLKQVYTSGTCAPDTRRKSLARRVFSSYAMVAGGFTWLHVSERPGRALWIDVVFLKM